MSSGHHLPKEVLTIVKQSVPALAEHGESITQCFYKILFANNPELKNLFNMANQRNGNQARALADAIFAYANLAEDPDQLAPLINRIANKHASLNILPEHYPMVGEALLLALSQVLKLPMHHEIIAAWGEAYGALASLFIDREKQIYLESSNQAGGWSGFRRFIVAHIEEETPLIKSFYLCPNDDEGLPLFKAGQYVGVKPNIPDHPLEEIRQYSLSDHPGQSHYRITVKIELGSKKGIVSNFLHQNTQVGDEVLLTAPCGDFVVPERKRGKLVLISAGVGITPMMSMLKTHLKSDNQDLVTFIHCAENQEHHCFHSELNALKMNHDFELYSAYVNDSRGDHQGFLTRDALSQFIQHSDADFYFCGPMPFMIMLKQQLVELGVDESRMHYEVFGPTLTLVA
ncbi:NO-inducible flavohemoprotein [Pleionea sp. CnH1-48]|uniref:NO-inducible flavohemoprotein n=1 Tax=Pleionea sp. CnH1-48 TaxID=2954494 RepID=UPI0020971C03|nr:NO-inducible flavohemoprotein [Pleionea sp. CnH1-48]MCO7222833.1 NO-inducible flavohemoprotein [Pleionea sp. CnH1-48]